MSAVEQIDHALGAVLGAFVGDACGAPLEFVGTITPELIDAALSMKGGGPLRIGAGQITDDSEMAMCQLQALHDRDPRDGFPGGTLLDWYRKWAESGPFDIGNTTIRAFGARVAEEEYEQYKDRVHTANASSKSNGSMMRMTPLIVWCRNLPKAKRVEYFQADSQLSHPNQTVQDACSAYGLAVSTLITNAGNGPLALEMVEHWSEQYVNMEVQSWILEESKMESLDEIDVTNHMGYVKWATILSFYHLREQTTYLEAIKQTIELGGDTDTNAAIVGGMMGAFHGIEGIPEAMRSTMEQYRYAEDDKFGYKRPDFVSPSNLANLINQLFIISEFSL